MTGGVAEAGYALLLRIMPPHQRVRYGGEMLEVFREERRRERADGVLHALWYVATAYADVAAAGWQMREREKSRMKYRDQAGWLTGLGRDVRHAARGLRRSWTFTVVCLMSLTIGLGINGVLLVMMRATFAPPPAVEANGAVELIVLTHGAALEDTWSWPEFQDVRSAGAGLDLTAWTLGTRQLRSEPGTDAVALSTMYVSANYFETLRVTIPRGRGFLPEEDFRGEQPAVVSHAMWQDRLGGDAGVLGRVLDLNGVRHRIVGVAPERYHGHHAGQRVDVWVPLWMNPLLAAGSGYATDRNAGGLQVIGRLHDGVNMVEAQGAINTVLRANGRTDEQRTAGVVRYSIQGGGESGWFAYALIMGMGVMVLLVVCFNVAGMVLVRSATKQRELSLRMALGSTRGRLIRFLMTESGLIALLGGLLSTAACLALMRYIGWRTGTHAPMEMLWAAVQLCIGLSIVAMLVIGLSPALRYTRPELLGNMKDDAGAGGRNSSRMHRIATSVQTAIALPLLVINLMVLQASGLMESGDYGFEQDNLYVASIDLAAEGLSDDDVSTFVERVPGALAGVAGVQSASVADGAPLDYVRRWRSVTAAGEERYRSVYTTRITENYFETIGTPVLRGRAITSADIQGAERVAVVTEMLARDLWPDGGALGERIRFQAGVSSGAEYTVVGVVADVAGASHETEPSGVFVSMRQEPDARMTLLARAGTESEAVATAIEDALLRLDPRLTRPTFVTSRDLMEEPRRAMRQGTLFVGVIAALVLLLAAIGVYGVVAFGVASRTREIGVRMAVGASRGRVLMMVLSDGARLAMPGLIVGAVLAAFIAHALLARWYVYFNRAPLDWVILTTASAGALAVVLLASTLPARRAASVQPMRALRAD